jgi:hypothetical protein
MLNAFSSTRKEYSETPDQVLSDVSVLPVFSSMAKNRQDKVNIKTNLKRALKRNNIPKDMEWILK